MKRISFRSALALAAIVCATGGMISCKDYLDVKPTAYDSPEDVFSDVGSATNALIGAYDMLSGDQGYGIRLNLYYPYDTDEMLSSPGANEPGTRRGIARYGATSNNAELEKPWNNLYQGIERANICIKYIPEMAAYKSGDPAAKRLHGEALVLRAQYFYELVRNWGDVPEPREASVAGQDFNVPKTDRDVIYDHLLADLAQAADLLPWRTKAGTTDERITKGAAKALRARIALARGGYSTRADGQIRRGPNYQAYYEIARNECSDIIAERGEHSLVPDFESLWRSINSLQLETSEIIFQVGSGGGGAVSDSKLGYYNGPRMRSSKTYGSTNGAINSLPTYFYAFDSTDTRRDVTVTRYSIESTDLPKATELITMTDGKFRRDWHVPAIPADIQNLGYNWPLIRYADVLLMFAEAQNELQGATAPYNGLDAKAALEQVRKRAYKNASIGTTPVGKEDFFRAVVKERFLEFGGEGIRKYDLIRWNLLATNIQATKDALKAMQAETGKGPYAQIPEVLYYKVVNGKIQWLTSFYRPAPATAPAGATSVDWRKVLTSGSGTSYVNNVASEYKPGMGKELLPIPQSAISANPNLKQNFGY